jgi:hypothetical protein
MSDDHIADGFRLFSYDPISGVETWVRDDGGTWTVRKVCPVDDLLDLNEMQRSLNAGTPHPDGISHVARLPMNFFYKYLADPMAQNDEKKVKQILNDPDLKKFRVREGDV